MKFWLHILLSLFFISCDPTLLSISEDASLVTDDQGTLVDNESSLEQETQFENSLPDVGNGEGGSVLVGNPGLDGPQDHVNSLASEDILAYSTDAESMVPVMIGGDGVYIEGMTDEDGDGEVDNYLLAISSDLGDFPEDIAKLASPVRERGVHSMLASITKVVKDFFIPTVHADMHHIQYFPIKVDGSVEAFYQFIDGSYNKLYLAIIDNNYNVVSDVIAEEVQDKLLYLNTAPTGSLVTPEESRIFTVTDGVMAEIWLNKEASRAVVQGSHVDGYQSFGVQGRRASYDGGNKVIAVVDREEGVSFYDGATGEFTDLGMIATRPEASEYTFSRTFYSDYTSPLPYYSIAEEIKGIDGKLYYAYEGTLLANYVFTDIKFLDAEDDGIEHERTLAFEMFETSVRIIGEVYAAVVFRDAAQTYIHFADVLHITRFGIPLGDYPGIIDLRIIHDQPQKRQPGKVALLDQDNSKIHFVKFKLGRSEAQFDPRYSLKIAPHPTAMALNESKTLLYVACKNRLQVYSNLADKIPTLVADVVLSDVIAPEKFLKFEPNGLLLEGSKIILTDVRYKSAIVLDALEDVFGFEFVESF